MNETIIEGRRREFAAFLRSRRERLTPASVGLPAGLRRRTQGLRREEVALLAGVGTTWYTWLEQGRNVRPSAEVLSALAKALRLDPTEQRHLFVLGDRPAPHPRSAGPEAINQPIRRMLESLTAQPAYVLGRRWDVLAWNRAAEAVFGDYGKLSGDERNIMHLVFANQRHRRLLLDWPSVASASLAMFRADSARFAGDPAFERLIADLQRLSPEFREWWPKHEVLHPLAGHKRLRHPVGGRMTFEYTALTLTDQPDMKFVVYTPLTEDQTAQKLHVLLGTPRRNISAARRKEPKAQTGRASAA